MKILIVDDAVTARMMITAMMKEIGYRDFEYADDGAAALERLSQIEPPGLVFVDWNMPKMNGLELIRKLRAHAVYDATRVLMVTTETGMTKVAEALEAGADEYVMKPFTKDMLNDKLRILGIVAPAWR